MSIIVAPDLQQCEGRAVLVVSYHAAGCKDIRALSDNQQGTSRVSRENIEWCARFLHRTFGVFTLLSPYRGIFRCLHEQALSANEVYPLSYEVRQTGLSIS